jgi:hypothetical protein
MRGEFYAMLQISSDGHCYAIQEITENKNILSADALVPEVNFPILPRRATGETKRQHSMFLDTLRYNNILNSYDCPVTTYART